MKNKKLFAILTLLCFMFTLMPVAAFAADADFTSVEPEVKSITKSGITFESVKGYYLVTVADGKVVTVETVWGPHTAVEGTEYALLDAEVGTPEANVSTVDGKTYTVSAVDAAKQAAAASTNVDAEASSFEAVDGSQSVKVGAEVKFDLAVRNATDDATSGDVLIWAEAANGAVSSALTVVGGADSNKDNVWKVSVDATGNKEVTLFFVRSGEYTVYAAPYAAPGVNGTDVDELDKFLCDFSTITVKSASVDPETYLASADKGSTFVAADADKALDSIDVDPNNVATDKIKVNFYDADKKPLKGETVTIETNSAAIEVNKASDVTNSQGEIDFKVSASIEGTYEVILTIDGVEWVIEVVVGNTAATYIEVSKAPTAPQALYENFDKDVIEFTITDINGNVVGANANGMAGILGNETTGKYVVLTEAPADTDLESEDLKLVWNADKKVWYLAGVGNMDAEGTYTVKVILDNGAYATASWEVKKFQTPVMLVIGTSTDVLELGGQVTGELLYYDANGVEKAAKDADFAATGYAVKTATKGAQHYFTIGVKDDEKYVDTTVTATAISTKYDLVATKEFKVADGAVAIAFVDKDADVNVNNKLEWNLVDSNGTRVMMGTDVKVDTIKYVVLDKPEGAKVSVNDATIPSDLENKGIGKLSLTSNKVGNVAVQVIVKAYSSTVSEGVTTDEQTKYYTGSQIFAVGTAGVGDVVVMSIGSNEIVINDAKATIDAAPIVENNRTFVPFRALAEAFGAEVAYDEATQAVTAELNGVTVVMTIGSAEYTVNGEAKTADVAPFINGSRTMVPVRFAAEAFGIKVIPTYDENGATADILFNL